jgi:hypothetical protein
MTRHVRVATFAVLAVLAVPAGALGLPRAQAQAPNSSEAGRSHFDRGVEYVHDGDLRGALIEFKRAYLASPNYRVLYNLGQVSNALGEYTEAQRYFQRYLTDGAEAIEPERKREVEALVTKLSGRIATFMLSSNVVGAELFVDNVSVGKSPLSEPVRVSTGKRLVSAAISGRPRITQVVEAAGGETLAVRLDFPPLETGGTRSPQRSAPEPSAKSGGPGPALWIGIGAGALAVGAGVMAYLAAKDAEKHHDALGRETTPRELDQLDERATTKALVTDILLGATAVATALTVVFAVQGSGSGETPPTRRDRASAKLAIGAGSVQLSGAFE